MNGDGKDWERKVVPDGGAVVINNRQCKRHSVVNF